MVTFTRHVLRRISAHGCRDVRMGDAMGDSMWLTVATAWQQLATEVGNGNSFGHSTTRGAQAALTDGV